MGFGKFVVASSCVAVTLGVLGAPSAVAASPGSVSARPAPAIAPLASPPGGACADVLFLGARGSGQKQGGVTDTRARNYDAGTGLGPEVYAAWRHVRNSTRSDLSIRRIALTYPAAGVPTSVVSLKGAFWRPSNWQNYIAGLEQGVKTAWSIVNTRAELCPTERVVLAGYSQGAMVMHRLLTDLVTARRTHITSRLDGVVLVGDGDNARSDSVVRFGSAVPKRTGVSRALNLGSARGRSISSSIVYSLCDRFDVVCDTGSVITAGSLGGPVVVAAAGVGIRAHTRNYPAHAGLRTAGARIGARVNARYPVHVVFVKRTGVLVPGRTWTLRVPDLRGASAASTTLFRNRVNEVINTALSWARDGSECPASEKEIDNAEPPTAAVMGHRVISVAISFDTYNGCGGVGNNGAEAFTLDSRTATFQRLSSYALANGHQLRWELVRALLAADPCVWDDLTASPYLERSYNTLPDILADWTVSAAGVTFWFDRYEVGPGACGVVHATVPWPALLRPGDVGGPETTEWYRSSDGRHLVVSRRGAQVWSYRTTGSNPDGGRYCSQGKAVSDGAALRDDDDGYAFNWGSEAELRAEWTPTTSGAVPVRPPSRSASSRPTTAACSTSWPGSSPCTTSAATCAC